MEITVNDMIASTELDWISPDGTKKRIVAGVGMPFESDRCWLCPVTLDGLHQELPSIAGEDSLQAIVLALAFINTRLRHLLEDGGRLAIPEVGGDFPIEAYFRPWHPRD
jgi:hypothetical protein